MNIGRGFQIQSKLVLLAIAVFLEAVIGVVEGLMGYEISLSIFYLIPVTFTTWALGRRYGISFAIVSAIVWFLADVFIARHAYSHPWIPFWNAMIRLGFFAIFSFLLSALKVSLKKEGEFSRRDFSTGIANGRAFFEKARVEIDRSRRYGHPIGMLYLDCDNFKAVNDRYGHQRGDELLRIIAMTLQENIRSIDIAARLGGDEFAVLLPETGYEEGRDVAHKLRQRLLNAVQQRGWPVTFSIGMATFTDPPDTVDELIGVADAFMYAAKNNGKDAIKHNVFSRAEKAADTERDPGKPLPPIEVNEN